MPDPTAVTAAQVRAATVLDYDEDTVAKVVAALATCPPSKALDSLVAATKIFIEYPDRVAALVSES